MAPRPKPTRERGRHFFRAWREKVFPNQQDAVEALGWSQSKISRLENGDTPYNQDDLEVAAEAFGCTPADLITRPPGQETRSPEAQLRSALLSYGVDQSQLQRLTDIIKTFVVVSEAQPEQNQSGDQSQPANHRRVEAPSR